MRNHQFTFCNCLKISNAISTIDSRHELLTPCILIDNFINDFDIDELKNDLETIFNGFLVSKDCEDFTPELLAGLYFQHRNLLKLLDNMKKSILLNRIDIGQINNSQN